MRYRLLGALFGVLARFDRSEEGGSALTRLAGEVRRLDDPRASGQPAEAPPRAPTAAR